MALIAGWYPRSQRNQRRRSASWRMLRFLWSERRSAVLNPSIFQHLYLEEGTVATKYRMVKGEGIAGGG